MSKATIDAGALLDELDRARPKQTTDEGPGEGIPGERGAADLRSVRKARARGARTFAILVTAIGMAVAVVMTVKAQRLGKEEEAKAPTARIEKHVPGLTLDPRPAKEEGQPGEFERTEEDRAVIPVVVSSAGGVSRGILAHPAELHHEGESAPAGRWRRQRREWLTVAAPALMLSQG